MSNGAAVLAFYRSAARNMAGLPVYNHKLEVDATTFLLWQDNWLGIIVTPWCMNIVILPGELSRHNRQQVGAKFYQALPSGRYEFIRAYAEDCGDFASCSVFSPMFEFPSQIIAMQTAQEVLTALFDEQNVSPTERHQSFVAHREMREAAQPEQVDNEADGEREAPANDSAEVSRRAFLTGSFAGREDSRP